MMKLELKLAKTTLDNKNTETIQLEKIEEMLAKNGEQIFYFDRDNPHKNIVKLIEYFEAKDLSVYYREVRYGLGAGDYMYEVHIL